MGIEYEKKHTAPLYHRFIILGLYSNESNCTLIIFIAHFRISKYFYINKHNISQTFTFVYMKINGQIVEK